MSWTKRQFIEAAFNELILANNEFDVSASELQTALYQLDAMMAKWNARGILLGYPLPVSQSLSSLDTLTTVPDSANEAIYTKLAVRLGPSFGKVVSVETKAAATEGYQILLSKAVTPNNMQLPGTLPKGAGNKPWRVNGDPFMQTPVDSLDANANSTIDFY